MEENRCFKCSRSERNVKLLDAVYDKEIVKICEECSVHESIPIIRRPSSFQLKEIERPYTVNERMRRMAGLPIKREPEQEKPRGITLDNLRKPKDYGRVLQDRQDIAKKANKPIDLVDNFHWHIQMTRRDKKISLNQLANMIGEAELAVKMIEQGLLPDDGMKIVLKIEKVLGLKLRKSEAELESSRINQARQPTRILNFNKEDMEKITIEDLKKMKESRERDIKEQELASKIVWNKAGKSENETGKKQESSKSSSNLIGSDIEFED